MADRPVLITEARPSADAELSARKRRYALTMMLRIPILIAAAIAYQTPWLAVTLILISVPLPWIAVLIANDRPAVKKKPKKVLPGTIVYDRAIERTYQVIETDPAEPAAHTEQR